MSPRVQYGDDRSLCGNASKSDSSLLLVAQPLTAILQHSWDGSVPWDHYLTQRVWDDHVVC